VATTVKLARALWIAPVALRTAIGKHHQARIRWPWFILLFISATIINTYFSFGTSVYVRLAMLSKIGLIVSLYLIGSNLSLATLRTVGVRPLLRGALLWIVITGVSLGLIYSSIVVL